MEKIYLEYNPFLKQTKVKKNGKELKPQDRLNVIKIGYLQNWLMESITGDWKGLPNELAKAINDDFEVQFVGRQIDYDDLKSAFTIADLKRYEYQLKWQEAFNDEVSLSRLDEIVENLEKGPFEELRDSRLKELYKKAKEAVFEVNVMATMSSGKSTLINALLGRELLPSKNEACTATVARITANGNLEDFEAECRDVDEQVIIKKSKIQDTDLDSYNETQDVYYIDIEGPIPALQTSKMQLRLVDTPGPNNSRVKEHGEITQRIVDNLNTSMVLYVLNATQLGIDDDNTFFMNIATSMREQGKQAQDRIIFVLNKCDDLDPEDNEALDKIIKTLKEDLKNRHGIEYARIIPVTAFMARLIRQLQCGEKLTRKENREIEGYIGDCLEVPQMHFEKYADVSPKCRIQIEEMLEKAESDEEKVLIHTGIPVLELVIKEYLEKYAYPMKLEDMRSKYCTIIDDIEQKRKIEEKLQKKGKEARDIKKNVNNLRNILKAGEEKERVKRKIDNIVLDFKGLAEIRLELKKIEAEILTDHRKERELEYDKAESMLKGFQNKTEEMMNRVLDSMQMVSINTINQASKKLYDEYMSYIDKLGFDLKLEGYDLKIALQAKDTSFGDFSSMMDDFILQHSYQEDILEKKVRKKVETKEVVNPKRKWWTFWRPETIRISQTIDEEYKEKVGEVTKVKVSEVIKELLSRYIGEMNIKFDLQKDEMEKEFERRKNYIISGEMKKLDEKLQAIMEQFEDYIKKEDWTEQEIQNLQKELLWIKESKQQLEMVFAKA